MIKTKWMKMALPGVCVLWTGAGASEHIVDVTTEVPGEIAIIKKDGNALESQFSFNYSPENGVEPLRIALRIVSNSLDDRLALSLRQDSYLQREGSAEKVSLNVMFNGQQLGASVVQATGQHIAPYPTVLDGELVIAPLNGNTKLESGRYSGTIDFSVANSTGSL